MRTAFSRDAEAEREVALRFRVAAKQSRLRRNHYFLSVSFFASALGGSFLSGAFFSSLDGAGGGSGVDSSSAVSLGGGGISMVYLFKSTFSPPLIVHMALKTSSGMLSAINR